MDSTTEGVASSKILEVLCQINARLEALDQRLQGSQPLRSPPTPGTSRPPDEATIATSPSQYFTTKYTQRLGGQPELREITILPSRFLDALQFIPRPCTRDTIDRGPETHVWPFSSLIAYCFARKSYNKNHNPFMVQCPEDLRRAGVSSSFIAREASELLNCIISSANGKSYLKERSGDLRRGLVQFEHLPTLLAPGTLLVSTTEADYGQVVEVMSCEVASHSSQADRCLVEYWHLRWDGEQLARTAGRFDIAHYTGTRRINDLPFHPFALGGSGESTDEAERSCRRYLMVFDEMSSLPKGDYPMYYNEAGKSPSREMQDSGHFIIDPKGFTEHFDGGSRSKETFNCYCQTCVTPPKRSVFEDSKRHLLLVPTRVEGFLVASRKWVNLPVSNLIQIIHTSDFMDRLIFDEATKISLKSAVDTYLEGRRLSYAAPPPHQDVIVSPPRRLIYHFHGPHGAGKTALAEALAEYSGRPLLILRLPQLSLLPAEFEASLYEWARLSTRWGAILVIAEADDLLQSRSLHEGMARNALVSVLMNTLDRFHGMLIFLTRDITNLDHALKEYLTQIVFPPPSANHLTQIFCQSLEYLKEVVIREHGTVLVEVDMLAWFNDVSEDWNPSTREVRDLFNIALSRASARKCPPTVNDLIEAYTARTGRQNCWDFVTEEPLYEYECRELHERPVVLLKSAKAAAPGFDFETAFSIPDDGRIPLTLSKSFLNGIPADEAHQILGRVGGVANMLQSHSDLCIVDWGWPAARWRPQRGCVYRLGSPAASSSVFKTAQQRWQQEGFTFGLRRLLDANGRDLGCGKPWRRLLLCQGLAATLRDIDRVEWTTLDYCRYLSAFPWVGSSEAGIHGEAGAATVERTNFLLQGVATHLGLSSPRRNHTAADLAVHRGKGDQAFHVVFYELLNEPDGLARTGTSSPSNTMLFYDQKSTYLRKSCFTMLYVPFAEGAQLKDALHWTIVCLTPAGFWKEEEVYAVSESPSLRAQALRYVAAALVGTTRRWRDVLRALDELVDSSNVVWRPQHQLQDLLFDDDAFSTSKRYFWAINFVHEAVGLLDDTLQRWDTYRRTAVTPFMGSGDGGEDWRERALAALLRSEKEAIDACAELERLRQAFQEKLDRITVMRDGLFNASAVMESRASTQLGENVKLLTFVSIFFLPLGLCISIWSVNESYSRETLIIVAVIVAMMTYIITFNLNNLAGAFHMAYAPRRDKLVEQMEQDPKWSTLGHRFKVFQRSQSGEHKPSELMVLVFSMRRMVQVVAKAIGMVFRFLNPSKEKAGGSV